MTLPAVRKQNMVVSMCSMAIPGLFMSKIDSRVIIFHSIAIIINSWSSIVSRGMDGSVVNRFVNRDGCVVNFGNMDRGMVNRFVNMDRGMMMNRSMVDWGMMNRGVYGAVVEGNDTMISLGQGSQCDEDKGLK